MARHPPRDPEGTYGDAQNYDFFCERECEAI
jgi:hypothetical protein